MSSEEINTGWYHDDYSIEPLLWRQRIAEQRDIDAMRHRPLGEQRESLLGAHLPIAAMDEQQRRRVLARLEKIDPVALARAIPKIEMGRMELPYLSRTPVPGRDDIPAAGDCLAIVQAAVQFLLAQFAPVGRVVGRRHANTPR